MSAAQQLVTEALEASVKPWAVVFSRDVADELQQALEAGSVAVVEQLGNGGSEDLAKAVVAVLFGAGHVPPTWWWTPLGRAVGPCLPDVGITQAEAAAILGVKRGTIAVRVRRGNLPVVAPRVPGKPGRPSGTGLISRKAVLSEIGSRISSTLKTESN